MGILDVPGVSARKARIANLLTRLSPALDNPFSTLTPAADTPTVTVSATPTITAGFMSFLPQAGFMTEVGSRGVANSASNRFTVQGYGGPPGMDFFLTGTAVEFQLWPANTGNLPVWVWVNGRPVTATPDTSLIGATLGSSVYLKLAFPSLARRRVELFLAGSGSSAQLNAWYATRVTVDTLVTPAPRKPVIGFVGDSFFSGSDGAPILLSAPFIMSRMLGVECASASWGGTGYVNPGAFQTYGSATRTALMQASKVEAIIMSGTVNDDPLSASVQAAALACYQAYAVACPNAPLIVFGPQPSSAAATVSANRSANIAAVKAACAASPNVLAFLDMVGTAGGVPAGYLGASTYAPDALVVQLGSVWRNISGKSLTNDTPGGTNGSWELVTWNYTGTGNTGAPAGNGTRDTFLYQDTIHPTPDSNAAFSIRQSTAVRQTLLAAAG